MTAAIFNKENWYMLEDPYFGLTDFRRIDKVKDSILLSYMLMHMNERTRTLVMNKMGLEKIPDLPVKIESRYDKEYLFYLLLQEQVRREDSFYVLKEAVYDAPFSDMKRFAFSRLTGYAFPYGWTYSCGLKEGMDRGKIKEFCREMIDRKGPFAEEAAKRLKELQDISDETLAILSSLHTERSWDDSAEERLKKKLRPAEGVPLEDDLQDKIRLIFDAHIYEICDVSYGRRHGAVFREIPYIFNSDVLRWVRKYTEDEDCVSLITKTLFSGDRMTEDLTPEDIEKTIWNRSERSAQHSYFLWMAYWYGIKTKRNDKLALEMLEDSAQGGFPAAYSDLVRIYNTGKRVRRDFRKALELQEKKTELYREKYEQKPDHDVRNNYVNSLKELGDLLMKEGREKRGKQYYRKAEEIEKAEA